MHGTCIVFYERLSDKLIEPVNKVIREWVEAKMASRQGRVRVHERGRERVLC